MFIVSSVFARVLRMAETRPTVILTNSGYDNLISQPKRLAVEHMPSNESCYNLRHMRFGGFNTFNRWDIFPNNWYAHMVQAAQQRQALKSELTDARNIAAEQKQKYEALEIKLAGTIETATEEKQKREALEVELADTVKTALNVVQHYEELEVNLADILETATEEKKKREAFEVELADVRGTVVELKQQRDALKIKIEDAEYAANMSKLRCQRLKFQVENSQEKVEDLTRQLDELNNAIKRERLANAETIDNMKREWREESQQADQQHQALSDALEKARKDAEFAADLPNLRCERLEFALEDTRDEVEELTRERNTLEKAIKREHSAKTESNDSIKRRWIEESQQADQRCQALEDALNKARKIAAEESFERKMVGYLLSDAREAMLKQNQQWEDRCDAMQRKHLAEIEHLRADTQLKPAGVIQGMSPPSTPHEISIEDFDREL
ncbi:hypothetical protein COEREDRAFT_6157 [Coemansia reversa NRRL 1564]|uniref:Uncharacterized protein n=1 Tax=Coemansia reversa (strain ATCC 12441 / NRRL 1564) TaxID=763665 RepID=A0A2G5BJ16_COERN|nr:hypothetical protein COEREDRAFT_6157 [Coemansia reversa NRRL 1564]|eukprot:PIA18996.1 hypothetical protein COEREDRAFT_6157 [Coemansia reversa NRRL 1564]